MIHITVSGTEIYGKMDTKLTSGSVGRIVKFTFDETWDGLSKTAVFRVGKDCRSQYLGNENVCEFPWELLTHDKVGQLIDIGVCGMKDEEVIFPTMYTYVGELAEGANPDADPSIEHSPELVEQLIAIAEDAQAIAQSVRDDADAGVFDGEPGPQGPQGEPGEDGSSDLPNPDCGLAPGSEYALVSLNGEWKIATIPTANMMNISTLSTRIDKSNEKIAALEKDNKSQDSSIYHLQMFNYDLTHHVINTSKNYFNGHYAKDSCLDPTNGRPFESKDYILSSYIDIPGSGIWVASYGDGALFSGDDFRYAFYDDNNSYIGGGSNVNPIAVPSGTSKVRMSFHKSLFDRVQFTFGEVPTPYEDYGSYINPNYLRIRLPDGTYGTMESQIGKLAEAMGDIDTALDSIITIQEALIDSALPKAEGVEF